jgi:hypothetical protein
MDYDALGIQSVMWIQEKYPPGIGRTSNSEKEEEEEDEMKDSHEAEGTVCRRIDGVNSNGSGHY